MNIYIISIISTLLSMLPLDILWLLFMAPRIYQPNIGHLMAASPNMIPAGLFYLLYGIGVSVFVVYPGVVSGNSMLETLLKGALLGLVAYGTYDLTNHATLKDWPVFITVVDMVWGALLTGSVSVMAVFFTKLLTKSI